MSAFIGKQQFCRHIVEVFVLERLAGDRNGSEWKSDMQRPLETGKLNYTYCTDDMVQCRTVIELLREV